MHKKNWLTAGEVAGLRHGANEPKRTWEAIRDTQVHTYDIRNNVMYTDAMIAKDELLASLAAGGASAADGGGAPSGGGGKSSTVVTVS